MAMKRTQADIHFSKCVREAADWTCQRCGKMYPENSPGLECAHFMTRGKWGTRFDPDNVAALCTGCHFYIDANPHEKMAWFEKRLGSGLAAIVREKSEDTRHGLKKLKKEISAHYRAEYKRLKELRAQGETGKLEIQGF